MKQAVRKRLIGFLKTQVEVRIIILDCMPDKHLLSTQYSGCCLGQDWMPINNRPLTIAINSGLLMYSDSCLDPLPYLLVYWEINPFRHF